MDGHLLPALVATDLLKPATAFWRSPDGVIAFWGDGAAALYGWTARAAVGRRADELLKTEYLEPRDKIDRELARRGCWRGQLARVTEAGERRVVETQWILSRDGVLEIDTDVTRLKNDHAELVHSRRLFRQIAETTPEVLVVYDLAADRILYANHAVQQVFGYAPEVVVAMAPDQIRQTVHPADRDRLRAHLHRFGTSAGELQEIECRLRARDGSYRWIRRRDVVFARDAAGAPTQILGVWRDVTGKRSAADALRFSEERTAGIIRSAMDAIIGVDADQFVALFNPAAERLFGCAASEALGAPLRRFIPGLVCERRASRGGAENAGLGRLMLTARIQGGEAIPVEAAISEVGEDGRPFYTVIVRDARAHARAETELADSRRRLQLAQAAGRIGMFEFNLETDALNWSPETAALYGVAPERLGNTGDAWRALVHPDDLPRIERVLKRAMESRRAEFITDFRVPLPDGNDRWIEARGRIEYGPDGGARRMLGINVDITERKRFESRLIEQAEALWRSNRELEQFAYVSSHDLKEPLRKIASFAQLLERRYQDTLDETGRHYLDQVSAGANRMGNLINDLLAFSRVTQDAPQHRPLLLSELVASVVSDLDPMIRDTGAEVTVEPLPTVRADPLQVRQLFQNLLSNAIKFVPRDRAPRVRVFVERRGESDFIAVGDNGIGIEPQYAERIFKLFQRLHPASNYPGTGIGLAISRKIVERHGGRIWVESEPGKGATFYFSLPLVPG